MGLYEDLPDAELLKLLKAGDEHAFESLYQAYSPQIYLKLLKLVKLQSLAEELLQDVFVKIWEKREGIDVEKSFRSYLYIIAQNLAKDVFRRAALDKKMLNEMINTSTEIYDPMAEGYMENNHKQLLQEVTSFLPPQRRKVYILIKIEGKSYEEVSMLLGISQSTINSHIVKANAALKKHFAENKTLLVTLLASFLIS